MAELPVKAAATNFVMAMARLPAMAAKIALLEAADAINFLPTLAEQKQRGGFSNGSDAKTLHATESAIVVLTYKRELA
jgi:hypothetical protein